MTSAYHGDERRLGERIMQALELALDENDLETAELLAKALETTLTRIGGPDSTDRRPPPDGFDAAFDRLEAMRHRQLGLS
ncbi:hypothetical protein M2352_003186 [Azospirillum fermentarium]|uniref:hypothetical protein n=1 Tax=Azospirillum fermentarium TaxID=1233114 RepID=UPI002227AD86|nr:hypothetical protein [Azospirillum fermentarium]MCW2247552.1 hypothetical protein [Azospirillum fermentarium]